jgi:hypothetical protein
MLITGRHISENDYLSGQGSIGKRGFGVKEEGLSSTVTESLQCPVIHHLLMESLVLCTHHVTV